MSGFLFDALHRGIERVLDLRARQHEVLASNIANVDTPGYRARTIDFDRALAAAMQGGDGVLDDPPVVEEEPPPWSADGNSVLLERETVRLKENAMLYEALSAGLSRRLALLRFAASDGRGGA